MDLEKVIKGLTVCSDGSRSCEGCPYEADHDVCNEKMKADTLVILKELRSSLETHCGSDAEKLVEQIDAQEQAIETLHLINAKLEGKVEAYENMLQRLVHE